jgi:hypothetical protein
VTQSDSQHTHNNFRLYIETGQAHSNAPYDLRLGPSSKEPQNSSNLGVWGLQCGHVDTPEKDFDFPYRQVIRFLY